MSTHGGNIRELAEIAGIPARDLLDFSANINPLGPPDWLQAVVSASLGEVAHYPDPECRRLVEAFSERYGVAPERVVAGNGSAEIIAALPRVLPSARALIPVPAYVDYAAAAENAGLPVQMVPLQEASGFALDLGRLEVSLRAGDLVFLGRPNNPTGGLFAPEDLVLLASRHSNSWFVVDEAFVEFVDDDLGSEDLGSDDLGSPAGVLLEVDLPNLVVVRSLTKLYAIPGLRLGFGVLSPSLAAALRRALPPWSVNTLAQAVGVAALGDTDYVAATKALAGRERGRLAEALAGLPGLRVFPGSANYLLVKIEEGPVDATELAQRMLRRGVAIRVCDDFEGLDRRYFRVAVRTSKENERLVQEIQAVLLR